MGPYCHDHHHFFGGMPEPKHCPMCFAGEPPLVRSFGPPDDTSVTMEGEWAGEFTAYCDICQWEAIFTSPVQNPFDPEPDWDYVQDLHDSETTLPGCEGPEDPVPILNWIQRGELWLR